MEFLSCFIEENQFSTFCLSIFQQKSFLSLEPFVPVLWLRDYLYIFNPKYYDYSSEFSQYYLDEYK